MSYINIIYFFHLPLFLFLSGCFHRRNKFTETVLKNKSLLISYYSYAVIFIILHFVIYQNYQYIDDSIVGLLISTPKSVYAIQFFGPMWFLMALFVIKMLCTDSKYGFLIYLGIYFIVSLTPSVWERFYFCMGPTLALLIFYDLGHYYKTIENSVKLRNNQLLFIGLVIF